MKDASTNDLYTKGIEHFNACEFFECHEVLEEVWLQDPGENKLFYQGIIQVAVSFYHYENSNYHGALKLLRDGIGKLKPYLPKYKGVDLEKLLSELELWKKKFADLVNSQEDKLPELKIPTIALD